MKQFAYAILLFLFSLGRSVAAEPESISKRDQVAGSPFLSNIVYSLSDSPQPEEMANWKRAIMGTISVPLEWNAFSVASLESGVSANRNTAQPELERLIQSCKESSLSDLSSIAMLEEKGNTIESPVLDEILIREIQSLIGLGSLAQGETVLLKSSYVGSEVFNVALSLKLHLVERFLIELSLSRGYTKCLDTIDCYLPEICKLFKGDSAGYHDAESSRVVVMAYPSNLCRVFNLSRLFLVALKDNEDGRVFREILTGKDSDQDLITWVLSYSAAKQDREILPLLKYLKSQVPRQLVSYFAEAIWRLENPGKTFSFSCLHGDIPVIPDLNPE